MGIHSLTQPDASSQEPSASASKPNEDPAIKKTADAELGPLQRAGNRLSANMGPDDSPIWQRVWFQLSLAVLVVASTLGVVLPPIFGLVYAVRGVLVPVLIALGLAYALNPMITRLDKKHNVRRSVSSGAVVVLFLISLLALVLLVLPPVVGQGAQLFDRLQNVYPDNVIRATDEAVALADQTDSETSPEAEGAGVADTADDGPSTENLDNTDRPAAPLNTDSDPPISPENKTPEADPIETAVEPEAESSLSLKRVFAALKSGDSDEQRELAGAVARSLQKVDYSTVASALSKSLDVGYGLVGTTIGIISYLMISTLITCFSFFFFSWHFRGLLAWGIPYIPDAHRDEVLRLVSMMNASVSGFIRGRLVQTLVMGILLAIGWSIVGVPYALLLAVAAGLMNLIPFAALMMWPVAVALTWLESVSGGGTSWMAIFLWPTIVFWIAQLLDGWVIEPIVQGKATNLNPLSVFLAVMVGASLAGLLGMLLAIPAAACGKIFMEQVVLPRMRTYANQYGHKPKAD